MAIRCKCGVVFFNQFLVIDLYLYLQIDCVLCQCTAINSTFNLSCVICVVMQQVDLEIPAQHNGPLLLPLPQAPCASCQNVPVEKV